MKKIVFISVSLLIFGLFSCKKENLVEDINDKSIETPFVKKIEFASEDGLIITADHYHLNKNRPIIVLCHQAAFSRGEYLDIADSLNKLGFNCLAIDQRIGNWINGVYNETKARAVEAGIIRDYGGAKQDMIAAVSWARNYYDKNVILWGSSYSASLAIIIGKENAHVDQVVAFAPLSRLGNINVLFEATKLHKPIFLTSSKANAPLMEQFYNLIPSTVKVHFIPQGNGIDGSKALWPSTGNYGEYWWAIKDFLID